jgi:hypothetical protein
LLHSVLTTGGVQEDLGLETAARSAILKVMRAVPEPFRPAAAATSQRILVDPARVRADFAAVAAEITDLYSNVRLG